MAYISTYTGDGNTTAYTIPFGYIDSSHLVVTVGGVTKTLNTDFTLTSASTLTFNSAPANAAEIKIERVTATNALVTYQQGALISADDLNTTNTQAVYVSEEAKGVSTDAKTSADAAAASASTSAATVSTNIVAIQAASGNAAAAAASETAAALSETNAGNFASSASTSMTNAAVSRSAAETAKTASETAQTAAETAKTAAETAETNAAASATSAASSASTATTQAATATTQATNAASSAATATTQANTATTQASTATSQASTATTKASQAATSATGAASSATSAATAQTAAEAARDSALAAFDSFDDRYLGAKSSGPSVDNDGNALVSGALYYDTTANAMQVYTGSAWVAAYASLSGALLVTNNLSDVNNAANSATNLGLGTGNTPTFNGVNTTGDISFGDNDKAKFGSSNDLEIFHDSNNSYIDENGTGSLNVRTINGAAINLISGSDYMATFTTDGAASLYYDNSKKFETSSSGISVTGGATLDNNGTLLDFSRVGDAVAGQLKYVDADTGFHFGTTTNHDWYGISNDTKRLKVDNGGDISFYDTSGNAKFFWDASAGNLGIGTSSPSNPSGTSLTVFDASVPRINLKNNTTGDTSSVGGEIRMSGNQMSVVNRQNSDLIFGSNNTERMRVAADGKVGIGTSSPDALAHIYSGASGVTNPHSYTKLHVESASHSAIQLSGSTSSEQWIFFADDTSSTPVGGIVYYHGSNYMGFQTNGAEDMRLTSGGDLHVDGNVIAYSTTISDERLKEDIKPIEGALDKVGQLSGYTFTYKADGKQSAGVIAQEVEAVLPSAVTESTLPLKTDDDVEYKTVQYDQLHGLLIEAIKELKAEIEELKNGASS